MMHTVLLLLLLVAGLCLADDTTPASIVPESPELEVSFYKLRIELKTTSDWTTLEPKDPSSILAARLVDASRAARRREVQPNLASLSQHIILARLKNSVRIVFDYYIKAPGKAERRLGFRLQKGALNKTSVRIYSLTGEQQHLVHEESVKGQHDPATKPYEFSLDLDKLRQTPAQETRIRLAPQKLLWAFYYPWYGKKDWSSEQLNDRPATRYASDDRRAIERHIAQAQSAGIDGFICSWWGPDDYTDKNLKLILDVAEQKRFLVTVYVEILSGGKPRKTDVLQSWLEYVIRNYGEHPAFMKLDKKPVIVVWASNAVARHTWKKIFSNLRAKGFDAAYLPKSYDTGDLEVFDGLHQYGTSMPGAGQAEFLASVARRARYYALSGDGSGPKACAASVMPGYDERPIPGRRGHHIDRKGGTVYRDAFEQALKMDPDWIFITSWNEWWEHTHIEPSELYGDQYLDITREYARKWKGK